jgi:hypothetical protein
MHNTYKNMFFLLEICAKCFLPKLRSIKSIPGGCSSAENTGDCHPEIEMVDFSILKMGVKVMITIFSILDKFRRKKWRFLKPKVTITFLPK